MEQHTLTYVRRATKSRDAATGLVYRHEWPTGMQELVFANDDDAQRWLRTQNDRGATRYPEVEVQLTGNDGNAFAVMGAITKALRRHGVSSEVIAEFRTEAMSGDYDNLLATAQKWVTCK